MEPHLDLAPAVAHLLGEPGDGLGERAEPDDVDVGLRQLGLHEIVIPVVAGRGHDQCPRAGAGQGHERQDHLAPLVGAAFLG